MVVVVGMGMVMEGTGGREGGREGDGAIHPTGEEEMRGWLWQTQTGARGGRPVTGDG